MSARLLVAVVVLGLVGPVAAAGPIAGKRLLLQHLAATDRLVFTSDDRDEPLAPTEPADDPVYGTPGGAVVELFRPVGLAGQFPVPKVGGRPGWRETAAAVRFDDRHRALSFVELLSVRTGRGVKLVAELPAGTLDLTPASIGMRISLGNDVLCARFRAVRRATASVLDFGPSDEAALADCSDLSLVGPCDDTAPYCGGSCPSNGVCLSDVAGGCRCALPTDACGDTAPACNGTCPAGERCTAIPGYPFNGCICVGDTPVCETSTFPTCGGPCGGGNVCRPVESRAGGQCACGAPLPCGGGGLDCAQPFVCGFIPLSTSPSCIPILCGGNFPTCGGGCPTDLACQPIAVSTSSLCVCGLPDQACSVGDPYGFTCPAGQVCQLDVSGQSASCVTP
jgi:hypothetical protein